MKTSRTSVALPVPVRRALRKLEAIYVMRVCAAGSLSPWPQNAPQSVVPLSTGSKRAIPLLRSESTKQCCSFSALRITSADVKNDATGLQLEEEHLPKRIRVSQEKTTREDK